MPPSPISPFQVIADTSMCNDVWSLNYFEMSAPKKGGGGMPGKVGGGCQAEGGVIH